MFDVIFFFLTNIMYFHEYTGSSPPVCACSIPGSGVPVYFIFNDLWGKENVCFVDINGIVKLSFITEHYFMHHISLIKIILPRYCKCTLI